MIEIGGAGLVTAIKSGQAPLVAVAAGSDSYPGGVHAGDAVGLSHVDANKAVGNIKNTVNIFGTVGTYAGGGGTETIEKYADGSLAAGASYTPATPGIFSSGIGSTGVSTFIPEYYSTLATAWYSPYTAATIRGETAIGDGTNFRIINASAGAAEYCLFRHYYSSGTYERNKDEQLAGTSSYTPAVSGFFADGEQSTPIKMQHHFTTAGWIAIYEATTAQPLTIVLGDGTNLRVYNSDSIAHYHVLMRAKMNTP